MSTTVATVTENPYFVDPLVVLVAVTVATRLLGTLGVESASSWRNAARYGLACTFAVTSLSHFTATRSDLVRLVPEILPYPAAIVTVTGVLELAGAVGLLRRSIARVTAVGLALLLVAMFPANVVAAREGIGVGGTPATPFWFRTLVQLGFIVLLLWTARSDSSTALESDTVAEGATPRR
ncbi:DoxX family protein [Salinigranum rubrum]|uniref:DoxX family protein n=1 Tax=Salinigranum rubrum TaxID=755307 RepID=UPI001C1F906C|nr:hypothetical protein [Salinigranum rubrum]